jgi:hypothetical protein
MSVKNRSYEVWICWLREKDARIHSAQQQKYTKTEQVEYEGKKEERRHNASMLKNHVPIHLSNAPPLRAASVQICPEAWQKNEKGEKVGKDKCYRVAWQGLG